MSSNRLLEQMQSHIGCICEIFLQSEFSNVRRFVRALRVVRGGYEWLWVVMAWFGAVLDGYEWLRVITCSLGLDMGG